MAISAASRQILVSSTDVESIEYIESVRIMIVYFIKTGPYTYFNIPPNLVDAFEKSPSKGSFANLVLKQGNFPYQKGIAMSPGIETRE